MPVPSSLASLSTTAASNSPAGTENPFPDLDDHLRAGYAFDAQNRDAIAAKLNASAVSDFGLTLIDDTSATAARTTLGAASTGANTFTGAQTLHGNAVNALEAVPKQQADALIASAVANAVANRMQFSLTATQATTSGTAIDFTGIPSWAKRLTLMISGLGTNGTSVPIVQLGTSAGLVTAGYVGSAGGALHNFAPSISNLAAGFGLGGDSVSDYLRYGSIVFEKISGNLWVCRGNGGQSESARVWWVGGQVALSDALDRVRLTTVGGTNAFDAGSVAILIEG